MIKTIKFTFKLCVYYRKHIAEKKLQEIQDETDENFDVENDIRPSIDEKLLALETVLNW